MTSGRRIVPCRVYRSCTMALALYCALGPGAALAQSDSAAPQVLPGQIAPMLEGLGEYSVPVTTESERTQRFFGRGLRLTYGFNHREAYRAFQEAARLDPECAMAYWGQTLALGPHLNQMELEENVGPAWEAIQKAKSLAPKATEWERAFIAALEKRQSPEKLEDRSKLDRAYAEAMSEVADRFSDNDDAQVLYAAALMNTMPWNYYTKDGLPREHTDTVLERLETVIARTPIHTGAHHYYIHATEEHYPERSEASADQLATLVRSAGHLVHMPSHIYMRVGRYEDAYESNRLAVLADEDYITQCRRQGIYPLAYYPHNVHFMAWAAQRQGRSAEAFAGAQKVHQQAAEMKAGAHFALYESFYMMPMYMMARFGMWDKILEAPAPGIESPYAQGIWHWGQSLAKLRTDDVRGAKKDLKALQRIAEEGDFGMTTVGFGDPQVLLTIASEIAAGEIALREGRHADAISEFERAVRLEDGLMYNEPPDWPYPARHHLGRALLEAGHAREAESVYWTDLEKNPGNPYSLFGLWQSLAAQGRMDEAGKIRQRFDEAWAKADVELTASVF